MRTILLVMSLGAAASGPAAPPDAWDPWAPADAAPPAPVAEPAVGPATLFGLAAIRGYQVLLSPLIGGRCQFDPSCSRFAFACIATHGLVTGTWRGADRISRCHGFADLGDYEMNHDGRFADPPGD